MKPNYLRQADTKSIVSAFYILNIKIRHIRNPMKYIHRQSHFA